MTKRQLVMRISKETGLTQVEVYGVLQRVLDYLTEALARGETIEFRDFGVFEVRVHKPRVGRNPKRPQIDVPIPARRVVKFKPGKRMKELITQQPVAPSS